MKLTPLNTAAIILCGGAGQRLNGADKGLLPFENRAMVEWVIDAIEPQVSDIVISANRSIDTYSGFGHTVVRDETEGYQGPLAGLIAALRVLSPRTEIQAVLLSSCDTPHLPSDLLERLANSLNSQINIAVAHDGLRKQNLHCLVRRAAWPSLFDFFENGGRAVHRWQKKAGVTEVDFSDKASHFLNINSLDQISD